MFFIINDTNEWHDNRVKILITLIVIRSTDSGQWNNVAKQYCESIAVLLDFYINETGRDDRSCFIDSARRSIFVNFCFLHLIIVFSDKPLSLRCMECLNHIKGASWIRDCSNFSKTINFSWSRECRYQRTTRHRQLLNFRDKRSTRSDYSKKRFI